ncbi:hypothetical protein EZV62_014300 [Acer yangbiense]|uniref:peroxidase n=1 Tax=Acer yangbiense TaxID=1000413 RepID=A0A5C7HRP9_9ROSI|nr:hypothetical protein EZV62_014300 [Acer yangbiense]
MTGLQPVGGAAAVVAVHVSVGNSEGNKLGVAFVGRMGSWVSEGIAVVPPDIRKINLETGTAAGKGNTRNSVAEAVDPLQGPDRVRHAGGVVAVDVELVHNFDFRVVSVRDLHPDTDLPVVDSLFPRSLGIISKQLMAHSVNFLLLLVSLIAFAPLCFCTKPNYEKLYPQFYDHSCPKAQQIVKSVLAKAVAKETRMAASLLRLHFHDCFVKGCDASILLDSSGSIVSEKRSNPNRNSARGFEVLDDIKSALEKECPHTVSCADIMALAARDSTVLTGGPSWEVPLGRRDSKGASLSGSNNNIPAPNNTFQTILTKFKLQGLNVVDLVALSGSHTIGNSRCVSFRQRLYNQSGNGQPDNTLDQSYAAQLRTRCPKSGGDQNLFFLDFVSPTKFDNSYFKLLLASKGLLNSDQVLFTKNEASMELVKKYAYNNELFFEQFAESMVKMGNISPLTGSKGEIRKNCRKINS